jgi:excisionase family DNA binding protein
MEKISIVRRRKVGMKETENGQASGGSLTLPSSEEPVEIPASILRQNTGRTDRTRGVPDVSFGNKEEELSVKLSPEQYRLVESSQYVKYFLDGEAKGVSLDVQHDHEGQIVFNFQFTKADTVRMLKSEHVCQMLQISHTLLMKLARAGKIKSYKIGRLRRFLLEDILTYLAESEEVFVNDAVKKAQEGKNDVL